MKYNRFIKGILLVGVVFVGVVFMLGSSQKDASGDNEYRRYSEQRKKINNLDPINRKKYEDLEKQKSHIDWQIQKYGDKRNQIIEKYHYDENHIQRRDTSFKNPVKAYINTGLNLIDATKRSKKFRKNLDDIDIKIDQAYHKRRLVQQKMDTILKESTKTCFPKNTKIVMADGTLKEIGTIEKGDKVMIYNIAKDVIGESSVNKKFINTNNHLYIINNSIKTTAYERFLTQDGWKRAHDIAVGDTIFNGNSYVDVDSIYKIKKDLTVYNLNIKSTHNFFVSFGHDGEWFLIHNCGGEGGSNK